VHEGTDSSANLTVGDSEQGESIALALLRKRVFTKSPVRENRTPGSVRGLSGNWQSYRDHLPNHWSAAASRSLFSLALLYSSMTST
jgi:hypothetical protein